MTLTTLTIISKILGQFRHAPPRDGVVPAIPPSNASELQAILDRQRQYIYGVPFVETRAGGIIERGQAVIADETATVRMTDVEDGPADLFTANQESHYAPDVPAQPAQQYYNFGYQVGYYADVLWERVPKTKVRRVRIWPPRRGFDRRLKDWPEHFAEEEYQDDLDTEVIQRPFKIDREEIASRMRQRRGDMALKMQYVKANDRSYELLRSWLSEEEYHSLTVKRELNIWSGKYLFTITDDPGNTIDVTDLYNNRFMGRYCLVTCNRYPDGDTLLTKIMLIKTDPEAFLQIGCN